MLNNHLAEGGIDDDDPTGPIAFATVEDAERFIKLMPAAATEGFEIVSMTMAELLEDAPAHWTQLWTVAEHANGTHTWQSRRLP